MQIVTCSTRVLMLLLWVMCLPSVSPPNAAFRSAPLRSVTLDTAAMSSVPELLGHERLQLEDKHLLRTIYRPSKLDALLTRLRALSGAWACGIRTGFETVQICYLRSLCAFSQLSKQRRYPECRRYM